MRSKKTFIILAIFIIFSLSMAQECFSQTREDKEEKAYWMPTLKKRSLTYKLTSEAGFFTGYDSNVNLSPDRKGDMFEEFLYSLNFSKPWGENCRFVFNYDLNMINYNEATDNSNLLNHLRFTFSKRISKFELGTGYDLGIFYYPKNEEGDFILHKPFLFVRNNLSKELYHQLLFEQGFKNHTHRYALSDVSGEYQDKELRNQRQSVEYSIGSSAIPKLSLRLRTRFSINDANARYQDYYDYKSYEISPSANYKLTKDLEILGSFSYLRRLYKERQVDLATDKERDNVYSTNFGMLYKLDKTNLLSLFYTYRNNTTNEPLERYTENMITCGWQHNF